MRGMTVLADPPAGRPDVAVVRQPIADERHTVVRLRAAVRRRARLARLRDRRQGHVRAARRRVRRHRPRGARRPPSRVDVDRAQLPDRDRARRRCAPTAPCSRSPPTRRATTCSPCSSSSAAAATRSRWTTSTAAPTSSRLLGLCSIVKVDVGDRDDATLAGDHRRAEAPRRPARRHRGRDRRGLRPLPRARLHLLPGRLLRQAADRAPPQRGHRRHLVAAGARRAERRGRVASTTSSGSSPPTSASR